MAQDLLRAAEPVDGRAPGSQSDRIRLRGQRLDRPPTRPTRSERRRSGRVVAIDGGRTAHAGARSGRPRRSLRCRRSGGRSGCCRRANAPNRRRDIGLRKPPRQQLLDLDLRLVDRPPEQREMVLVVQARREEAHRREVQQAVGQHRNDHREPSRGVGGFHPVVGLVLREVEHRAAIPVERPESHRQVQVPRLQLGQVCDEGGGRLSLGSVQGLDLGDQLLVREVMKSGHQHARSVEVSRSMPGPKSQKEIMNLRDSSAAGDPPIRAPANHTRTRSGTSCPPFVRARRAVGESVCLGRRQVRATARSRPGPAVDQGPEPEPDQR